MKLIFLLAFLANAACAALALGPQKEWLAKVPEGERARMNPLLDDASAVSAGTQIYAQHCDSCHGKDARGSGRKPSLRTLRVHASTDGELQWLLRNGSLGRGMPAWSNLPEVQRWQLVRYLHALPVGTEAK